MRMQECDTENARLAEKGIVFTCPNRNCAFNVVCPHVVSHWDLDIEFDRKYHRRTTEKCCASCMHGDVDYDGEARCSHPKRGYKPGEIVRLNVSCESVCDLWESRKKGGAR